MLKKVVISVALLLGMFCSQRAYCHSERVYCHSERSEESLDSTVAARIDERLAEYFAAIEREGTEVQKGECDFLIETCTDSLMRQHVALAVYGHYMDSKVMGSEAVAIHVFDKWFASGLVKMRSDAEMLAAKIFAEFNRQSLIGGKAPELTMEDIDGELQTLFGPDDSRDRFRILYFYDTSCATCKVQTILLRNLLQDEDFPVDLYAVYASDNRQAWTDYVEQQLDIEASKTKTYHLWDPELDSDFQRKYGVIQTPRMFLIAPDGTVLGRGLDAAALSQLLHSVFDEVELEYGGDESEALYDSIFGDSMPSGKEIGELADYIASSTLERGDTVMFRQMTGDLLYYLTLKRGEGFKEGLDLLIDRHILSRNDIWKSEDDSLKIVGMAQIYDDLLARSTPGKLIPDMKLPGLLYSAGKVQDKDFRLRKLRGQVNYIMFVTDGCHVCAAEKEAAVRLVAEDRKVKVLMVNVDDVLSEDPGLAGRMFDAFDLSSLPFILKTDRKGNILGRYLSVSL